MIRRRSPAPAARVLIGAVLVAAAASGAAAPVRATAAGSPPSWQVGGAPELLFDQGKRLFDAFQYDQALPIFDRLVTALTSSGPVQKPDLLVQAYELRGRCRFALGDSLGTEQDFSALLAIKPDFKLGPGISPRVVTVFDNVRRATIGQVAASMTPPGDADIDGRTYALQADPIPIDLQTGDHQVTVTRPGYRPVTQKFTVTAGAVTPLALTMERVSSTLSVITVPDGVDVLFDGTSRGLTKKGDGSSEASSPLMLTDLQIGTHRLQLRRGCYTEIERTITIDRPGDLQIEPLHLTPAVATVKLQAVQPGAALVIDGAPRGEVPPELTVCEGSHLIEVRGAKGRFIDRRVWKTGEQASLAAELRSAFPIVSIKSGPGLSVDQLRVTAERVLARAAHVLVYAPVQSELDAALAGENAPGDWLAPDPVGANQGAPRVPREVKRELGRRLATKLQAQGVAAVSAGPDAYTLQVSLLAAGSGEPDVLTINTADSASQARAVERVGAPLAALAKPSIETSVVDVQGVPGAVVVRASGVGAKAGLVVGDVIVGAANAPVASVAELRAKIAGVHPPAMSLPLDVKGPTGAPRKVAGTVAMVADSMPLQDHTILNNRALIELADAVSTAATPLERSAARVDLAIVQMRLLNWDEALASLKDVQLPEGPGVSAGTAAYLTGLCLEALGRAADARAAFTKAAAATEARLSSEGPLVAPLAQQKLRSGG